MATLEREPTDTETAMNLFKRLLHGARPVLERRPAAHPAAATRQSVEEVLHHQTRREAGLPHSPYLGARQRTPEAEADLARRVAVARGCIVTCVEGEEEPAR